MLPQFELQKKRRMHAKRRRQEQRQKIFRVVVSVLCLLGALIIFNVYYIFRNEPQPSNNNGDVRSRTGGNVRRRGPWVTSDAQPFVRTFEICSRARFEHSKSYSIIVSRLSPYHLTNYLCFLIDRTKVNRHQKLGI